MTAPVAGAAIVVALVSLHETALGAGWTVVDGPEDQRGYAARSASVACPWNDEQDGIAYTRTANGLARRVTEEFTIACSLYSGDGEADMTDHRADVAAAFQAIDDGLVDDPTLGGIVEYARLGDATWISIADDQGTAVAVGYTIIATRLP